MHSISTLFRRHRAGSLPGKASIFALLAIFATSALAQGLPDRGQLRLQMGTSAEMGPGGIGHDPRRFLYVPIAPTLLQQTIGVKSKCILQFAGSDLVALSSTGGNGSGDIGVGPDSLGVPDGPKGVACYRFSYNKNEVIEFSLGTDTTDAAGIIDANAFYRLELDIEVKKNALLFLEVMIGGSVIETYELRSGNSIDPTDPDASETPGAKIWNCNALSDSGSDAGRNDNCRWEIEELGQTFRLWAAVGEASWEGGGDFTGEAYDNNSVIYLTKANVGALGCGENSPASGGTDTGPIGDGENDASCAVTRLDPSSSTGGETTCTVNIGYLFRNLEGNGIEGCELIKFDDEEQLAASIDICFPPEPRQDLGFDSPMTEVEFVNPLPNMPPFSFIPERCTGTVVLDSNGNRIISEVLNDPDNYDLIDTGENYPDDKVEFACILDNAEEYKGPLLLPKMQVCQTILFWGDIRWSR